MTKSLLSAFILLCLMGCSKDKTTSEVLMDGTWQVSKYLIGGTSFGDLYKDYTFVFAEKNVLKVTKDNTTMIENWFANTSTDGTKHVEFSMVTPELKALEGTWNIMGISSGSIALTLPGDSAQYVKRLDLSKL